MRKGTKCTFIRGLLPFHWLINSGLTVRILEGREYWMGVLCDLYTRGRPRLLNCTHKPAVKCWLMMRPETQRDRQQSNLWTLQSVLRIIPSHKYHPIHSARTRMHALAHYKVTANTHTHTVIGFGYEEVLWSIRVSGGCYSRCCAQTQTYTRHPYRPGHRRLAMPHD